MMIGHIPVEEIPVVPADDPWVGTNVYEATLDVLRGN